MDITGHIKKIFESQQITQSFQKREFVVTTEEQYPQDIIMEFSQDKCGLLNNFKCGDKVKVSINIRGREWVNPEGVARYFNSIQAWRIELSQAQTTNGMPHPNNPTANDFDEYNPNGDDDDLPF